MSSPSLFRVKLHEGNVKAFQFNLKNSVQEATAQIAEVTGKNTLEYGLFFLPGPSEPGKWMRNDFPLEFYSPASMDASEEVQLEFKSKSRPIRVLLSGGVTYTTVMVNDTLPVKAITEMIGATVGFENAMSYDKMAIIPNGMFLSAFFFFVHLNNTPLAGAFLSLFFLDRG
jgi:hypothetical protein